MEKTRLLEENVNIKLSALQTLLLSQTVVSTGALLEFLVDSGCVFINKVKPNGEDEPEYEQTGLVMMKASLAAMQEIHSKIWISGTAEFGEEVPEDLADIVSIYTKILNGVFEQFLLKFMN